MPGLRLQGEISLDGSGWNKGLNDVNKSTSGFVTAISSLKGKIAAAFSVGAIVAFGKSVNSYAMEINHLSEQFHLSTEEAQRLMKAAGRIGVDAEMAATSIFRLADARRKAAEGDIDKREMFEKYGIQLKDLMNSELNAFRFAQKFAEGLGKVGVNAQTDADMLELVGIRGVKIIGVMEQIALQGKIKIIDEEDLEIIRQFNIELKALMGTAKRESVGAVASLEEWLLAVKHLPEGWEIAKDIAYKRLQNGMAGGPSPIDVQARALKILTQSFFQDIPQGNKPADMPLEMWQYVEDARAFRLRQYETYKPKKLKEAETTGDMFKDKLAEKQREELDKKWEDFWKDDEVLNRRRTEKTTMRNPSPYSDALLEVGNFLGAGNRSAIDSVSQQQLQAQQEANRYLDLISKTIETIAKGSLLVPTGS